MAGPILFLLVAAFILAAGAILARYVSHDDHEHEAGVSVEFDNLTIS